MSYQKAVERIEKFGLINDFNEFASREENKNLHIVQAVGK